MDYVLDVTNEDGIPFRVVYGRREYLNGELSETEVVSFYDRRYDHTKHGQFVSDYLPDSIWYHPTHVGLDLYGGVDAWTIDRDTMAVVNLWLRNLPPMRGF